MTAERSPQKNAMSSGTALSTGALIFAALTLLFALFALFLGNRMSSLQQSQRLKAQKESVATETTAVEEMKSALDKTQQDLQTEKAGSTKLHKQLDAAMQELKTLKAELANSHRTIDDLKAKAASAAPSLPAASPQSPTPVIQQGSPAVTSPGLTQESLPSNTPASETTVKASDSPATVQGEPAAEPLGVDAVPEPETTAPAAEKPQTAIEESHIEADPVDAGGQSPPKAQQPAIEASKPAATN